ncbi:hypothetical protein HX773_11925 [Pantoea sp. B9002]|uniref:Ig-like domain-containing protein n=1 Tax=Pantoea sp. B9002 TaxID=2726979 RepID=UPI00159F75A7|nr:Ig-like domain-containing protein [Pantoea sp. B9002]NWA61594.1 hypothetical protein [Pantoea sp. B9002]
MAFDNVGQQQYLNGVKGHQVADDTRPELRGRATAGEVVKLYDGEVLIGSTVANQYGNWTITPVSDLSDGTHALVVKTASQQSSEFFVNVKSAASEPVVIYQAYDNVVQHQYLGGAKGEVTDDPRPEFTGRACAGELVKLYSGNQLTGSAMADAGGMWRITPSIDLTDGTHALVASTATQLSEAFNITVQGPASTPVLIDYGFDDVGQQQYLSGMKGHPATDDARTQ